VIDAYILIDQYLDRCILLGGKLLENMPDDRQLVYLEARFAEHMVKYNRATADDIKKAMDALIPYLK
jgi:DNA-directed RNA polymerase subunit F